MKNKGSFPLHPNSDSYIRPLLQDSTSCIIKGSVYMQNFTLKFYIEQIYSDNFTQTKNKLLRNEPPGGNGTLVWKINELPLIKEVIFNYEKKWGKKLT